MTGGTFGSSTIGSGHVASASTVRARRASETKAIVLEFNVPMLIDVLVELSRQYGWNRVYITSNYTKNLVKQHFPSIVHQVTNDARFGQSAPEFADIGAPGIIDQPTAEALGYAEIMALKQMDRLELTAWRVPAARAGPFISIVL